MARITGIELNDNWKVAYALTHIKGIGWALSENILKTLKINDSKRIADLSKDEISKIAGLVDKHDTEGDLTRQVRNNIKRLQTISAYRGSRHQRGLPSRGQRTKSNARTKRGKRKTVGAFKKETLNKTQQTK